MIKIQGHKKIYLCCLTLALAVILIVQTTVFAQECNSIRTNLVRLHVLANSNSEQDQALKLKVRDAILAYGENLFTQNTTKEQALAQINAHLPQLTRVAEETLEKEGCSLPVTCQLEEAYFNTRVYDTVTLPAGTYTALRVLIGEGAGKNWWCVMFPPLCISAAQEVTTTPTQLDSVLTQREQNLVLGEGPRFQMKFKVVEWAEQAKQWLGF